MSDYVLIVLAANCNSVVGPFHSSNEPWKLATDIIRNVKTIYPDFEYDYNSSSSELIWTLRNSKIELPPFSPVPTKLIITHVIDPSTFIEWGSFTKK